MNISNFFNKHNTFIHYCIISLVCTIILYAVYYIINYLTNNMYILANFIAYLISFTILFCLNRKLFKVTSSNKKIVIRQILYFIISKLIGFIIDSMILILLIERLEISPLLAKIISSCITFFYNYYTNKKYVFTKKQL